MHVKTYTGKTPAEALTQVKAELGDEAVILSNKTVNGEDGKYCEIMAAVETMPDPGSAFARAMAQAGGQIPGRASGNGSGKAALAREAVGAAARAAKAAKAYQPGVSRDDFLTESLDSSTRFSREWRQIKKHFLTLMKSQMDFEALAPRQRVAMEYLEREGVAETGLAQVYQKLLADPERTVLPVLEELAQAAPFSPRAFPQKFQLLAGPHGVGKTSCAIRLALMAKKENPKARVCLVAAGDCGRGKSTLRHYAELSGLAFREAATAEDFQALFQEARSFDLVLVDLPAMHRGAPLAPWLEDMGLTGRDTALHLALCPHYRQAQLETFLDQYQGQGIQSLIWTKLDEACTFGALVNLAHASGLPASALSFGPGLTDSLAPAHTEDLWRLLFKHQLPGPCAEA